MSTKSNVEKRVRDYLQDTFFKTQCEIATEMLLTKFDIDTTCKFIKSYQGEYLAIKECEPELARHYTFEIYIRRHLSK